MFKMYIRFLLVSSVIYFIISLPFEPIGKCLVFVAYLIFVMNVFAFQCPYHLKEKEYIKIRWLIYLLVIAVNLGLYILIFTRFRSYSLLIPVCLITPVLTSNYINKHVIY